MTAESTLATSPEPSAALAIFLADPSVGICLTGDPWRCEQAFRQLEAELRRRFTMPRIGPETAAGNLVTATLSQSVVVLRADLELQPEALALARRAESLLVLAPGGADLPAAVADRCALIVEFPFSPDGLRAPDPLAGIEVVRPPAPGVASPLPADEAANVAVRLAEAFGVRSHELDYRAAGVARVAHFAGVEAEVALAAWVFGPRARPPVVTPPPPPAPPPDPARAKRNDGSDGSGDGPESIAEPLPAEPPPVPPGPGGRARRALPGRRGPRAPHPTRGQPGRAVPWKRGERIDLQATLVFALPRLPLRGWQPGAPLRLSPSDLRRRVRRARSGSLQIIVVDASGSMAREAIRRAKGAAISTLRRAYVERRAVSLVVARGRWAFIAVPPTRSVQRVARRLRHLPAGGGTPLASAYLLAARLARRHEAASVEVTIFSDNRPNIPLVTGGDARQDAARALDVLQRHARAVVVDPCQPAWRGASRY